MTCVLHPLAAAEENYSASRYWRLKGKILENVSLEKWSADRLKVTLKKSDGKVAEVAVADLSAEDQAFIRRAIAASDQAAAGAKALLENDPVFKQFPAADRMNLPLLDQGKFGQKGSDCVPSSFCNFLLWWDQQNVLPIGKRGDFDRKAEWIHTQMARFCRTGNNSGTSYDEAVLGFHKYFDKETSELSTYSTKVDYDVRPENLARYTIGYNATLLGLTTRSGNRESGHMVALLSATPAGEVVFHTWGHKMKGKIVVSEKKDEPFGGFYGQNRKPVNATIYEIQVEADPKFEDWVRETRFFLNPENWDCLIIVKPYVFAQSGTKSAPPQDPLMAPD